MQSVSSRIWTRVAVSISYDDNHYTTGTSILSNTLHIQIFDDTNSSYFFKIFFKTVSNVLYMLNFNGLRASEIF